MARLNLLFALLCCLLTVSAAHAADQFEEDVQHAVASPDGKYTLVVVYDGPAAFIRIYKRRVTLKQLRQKPAKKRHVSPRPYIKDLCDGVANARWAPKHGHTFVFGVSDVYGNAKLAMWHGGKRYVTLVRRRYKVDTRDEHFTLYGISSDGKRVYYGYVNESLSQSYRIALAPGSKPQKINRGQCAKDHVWDKHVILTGN